MKKLLMIIALTLCIFQMVVLATAIDVGAPAIDRAGSTWPIRYTTIAKDNPANASGTITSVEIWCDTNLSNCEIATFYEGASNVFSTRDTHTIGSVTSGSKQTFSGLSLTVQAGDYIGFFGSGGYIDRDPSGFGGIWYTAQDVDNIPCTDVTFSFFANDACSIYATGTTAAAEEDNVIFFGMNF